MQLEAEDFVEILKEGHPQHGLTGRIINVNGDVVVVNIYGQWLKLNITDVKLKAKFKSRAHMILNRTALEWNTDRFTEEDYKDMIDFALDVQDYAWCKELQERLEAMG